MTHWAPRETHSLTDGIMMVKPVMISGLGWTCHQKNCGEVAGKSQPAEIPAVGVTPILAANGL